MTYLEAKRKLRVEQALMAPFVLLGRLAGKLFKLKGTYKIFLFYPNADIGGAPRVNLDITQMLQQERAIIFFSKKAHNDLYAAQYKATGVKTIDLHKWIDNKLFHFVNFFVRGLLASWINREQAPVVFGGESIFFYKVIPHLRKDIRCVELTHVDRWLPYNIGFIDRIDARIFSTRKGLEAAEAQYRQNNLGQQYFERLFFVDNAIDIPAYWAPSNETLQVFFIGRGAPQKRIELVAAIAAEAHRLELPLHINFVGDVDKIIHPAAYPFCSFYGTITDADKMNAIYTKADVLLLTSAFEGLPVVVMQMMAHGRVVVSTAVSGIPDYIRHRQNGMLIFATKEEDIIAEGLEHLRSLTQDAELRAAMGLQARKDAERQFSRVAFQREYRRLLML